jgi:hypothetical protein
MRRAAVVVAILGVTLTACVQRPTVPFELTDAVKAVLIDWQEAELSCGEPQVGMPGPAVDWVCRGEFEGVELSARLIADRFGVQSIHAGVPRATSGADAARAFITLVRATSLLGPAEPEISTWLLANNANEGTMPTTATTAVGRAAVAPDSDGSPVLYLVPLGSSMLIQQ